MSEQGKAATPEHYRFHYHGVLIDPYRILLLYGITHPAQQHAIKKLLRAGKSHKSFVQDVEEVIVALQRLLDTLREDDPPVCPLTGRDHRWVGGGDYGDPTHSQICGDCGIDLQDLPDPEERP